MDYYAVLEVERTASLEEIKKSYRNLAKKYHPDRNPGDNEAVEQFKKVQEAYETLGDTEKRAYYDRTGQNWNQRHYSPPPPRPPQDEFFRSVFNTFFGGDDRGRHVQVRLELDLEQLLVESVHPIKYAKRQICRKCRGSGASSFKSCAKCLGSGQVVQVDDPPFQFTTPCPDCRGSGKSETIRCGDCAGTGYGVLKDIKLDVRVPAGIEHGMQVRVRGAGEEGAEGDPPGDLFVVVLTKPHQFFKREGVHLTTEIPVSYSTLIAGGDILIPTLDKTFMSVKVPPGTQSGTKFRLKGRGLPNCKVPNSLGNYGDILATVKLEVPQNLPDDYVQLLERLRELERLYPGPKVKAYSEKVK